MKTVTQSIKLLNELSVGFCCKIQWILSSEVHRIFTQGSFLAAKIAIAQSWINSHSIFMAGTTHIGRHNYTVLYRPKIKDIMRCIWGYDSL